jgi:hypothetical protein
VVDVPGRACDDVLDFTHEEIAMHTDASEARRDWSNAAQKSALPGHSSK